MAQAAAQPPVGQAPSLLSTYTPVHPARRRRAHLGYYRQWQTDDYWVRARVLRPPAGRWLSRDPLMVSLIIQEISPDELYTYLRNSPTSGFDPSGRGQEKGEKWVLVWVGTASGMVLQRARRAVKELKDKGYDTKKVGRTWGELRSYQKQKCLFGLLAVAHGRCDWRHPYCEMETGGYFWQRREQKGRYVVTDPGSNPGGMPANNWMPLHRTSKKMFQRLSAIHCMNPRIWQMLVHGEDPKQGFEEIKQWYADRLGTYGWNVYLCPGVDKDPGGCTPPEALKGIEEFLNAF